MLLCDSYSLVFQKKNKAYCFVNDVHALSKSDLTYFQSCDSVYRVASVNILTELSLLSHCFCFDLNAYLAVVSLDT